MWTHVASWCFGVLFGAVLAHFVDGPRRSRFGGR